MDKSIETTRTEFNSVRTGRASAALLDRITIDYYGTPTPLNNMATIWAPEARLLSIQPYDATQIKAIEKAIQESDLGSDALQRRQADPAADPAADRGAPQGARQGRATLRARRARSRSATSAAT